jgi:hypothetical protein
VKLDALGGASPTRSRRRRKRRRRRAGGAPGAAPRRRACRSARRHAPSRDAKGAASDAARTRALLLALVAARVAAARARRLAHVVVADHSAAQLRLAARQEQQARPAAAAERDAHRAGRLAARIGSPRRVSRRRHAERHLRGASDGTLARLESASGRAVWRASAIAAVSAGPGADDDASSVSARTRATSCASTPRQGDLDAHVSSEVVAPPRVAGAS